MSLEVRFDGTLIDDQYYTGLTNNNELFNESFKLGATPCNQYTLRIAKEGILTHPTTITLSENGITFANSQIDNIEEEDYEYVYTLTDKMVNLEFYYDASEIFSNGSTTLLLIAQDICQKAGLILGTTDFRGYNKEISWYDNTRTARQYIGYIAELNGGFARIENNTLYFIKQKMPSKKIINIDDCENFTIGERHEITRVVYELGSLKYEYGNENGNTLYLNNENVFITEENDVQGIYDDIKNFEFYSFSTKNCPIDYNVRAGDIITFYIGIDNYQTIAQYDLEYFGEWIGGYSLDINTEKQEETKTIGNKENIKNLKVLVDRQNNIIQQIIEDVGDQNNKISSVTQSVDEINSKIQDIADITVKEESSQGYVTFENINESEPIAINIHPLGTNISYLYPRNDLYPSNTLYMPNRILRFVRTYTENGTTKTQNIDYELPDDLLYYNAENYDEFILSYDTETCQVIKKCKYNADGTVGLLANQITKNYTYPLIQLGDGDYSIQLLGYNSAYLMVRLMASNIYTTQFATKAEMRSEINQTATEITSTVSATYETKQNATTNYSQLQQTATSLQSQINNNNTDISTLQQTAQGLTSTVSQKVGNDEIISKINQSSEAVQINANKISLAGKEINLTGDNTTIKSSNFNVDKNGNMSCSNASVSGTINATNGTFQNCTITNSCSVPASTVSGTLGTSTIPNLNANKLTSGKIKSSLLEGVNATFGTLNATAEVHSGGYVDAYLGFSYRDQDGLTTKIAVPTSLTVVDGKITGQTWRRLVFKGGILTAIETSW